MFEELDMIDPPSIDLMRAYAKFTPSGLPKDRNQENLRRFRRSSQTKQFWPRFGARALFFWQFLKVAFVRHTADIGKI